MLATLLIEETIAYSLISGSLLLDGASEKRLRDNWGPPVPCRVPVRPLASATFRAVGAKEFIHEEIVPSLAIGSGVGSVITKMSPGLTTTGEAELSSGT